MRWSELLLESTQKSGRGFDSALFYGEQLRDAGWTDIKLEVAPWPMARIPILSLLFHLVTKRSGSFEMC